MTEPEVVYRVRPTLTSLTHRLTITNDTAAILAKILQKTSVRRPLEAKPEVEIWRRHDISTQRPRFSIRLPIHYGVYL